MTFLETALDLAGRGFHVFPLKPRDKWPIVAGGFKAATRDPEQISLWWKRNPDANVGIACEASNLCVVDCDHGFTCAADAQEWCYRNGLPITYMVRSGRRPEFGVQLLYRGAIAGMRFTLDGVSGDIKSVGGLVVAPPSIHPDSGEAYTVISDAPLAPTPEVIRQLKQTAATKTEHGGIETESRNAELCSFIGTIRKHTHSLDEPTCLALCLERNDQYAKGPLPEDEVKEIVAKQYRLYPDVGPDAVVTIGGKAPTVTVEDPDIEEVEELDSRLRATPLPDYPVHVFDGTLYMDFAKRAAEGNFVPLEFFIEGAMTYAGAMAADNLHGMADEITPRLFTVLLAMAGLGKGTTFRRLRKLAPQHRMLDTITEQTIPHASASIALLARAGSEPGLNDALLAWKCVCLDFEEMDRMMEKTNIEGSGGAFMSVIRTLFDDIHPGITTTSQRKVAAPVGYLSLLGAMTPSLWRKSMEGKDSYGSGLGGRFNLVATNQEGTAATLLEMHAQDLQSTLDHKLADLERGALTIPTEQAALNVLADWWTGSAGKEHYNRVNVITHRKALHIAWMRESPIITKEIMLQAVQLADYLIGVRDAFAVTKGEDRTAIGENRIMHVLKQIAPKWVGEKKIVALLDGLMSRASVHRALVSLVGSGEAEETELRRTGQRRYKVYRLLK